MLWLGLRAVRRAPPAPVAAMLVDPATGIDGDHARSPTRAVTLIGGEDLDAIASFLGRTSIDPALLRRNVVVRGINLAALKGRVFRVGEVVLRATGACHPCSRMEELLGSGGYNAVRGHGGITAAVLTGGTVRIGDEVERLDD